MSRISLAVNDAMLTLLRLPKSLDWKREMSRKKCMSNFTHSQNEIFHGNLNLDPFVICQSWPHKMRLRYRGLVGVKDDLRLLVVDVQST